MPINTSAGITLRTVTFWYSAASLRHRDWTEPLARVRAGGPRPQRRLLAAPACAGSDRHLLAAPVNGAPVRCAGGRLDLLDLEAAGAEAADQAHQRYHDWARTGRIRGSRPAPAVRALLDRGHDTYVTYHRLRRVVGDALIIVATDTHLHPAGGTPERLVEYVRLATAVLADANPHDVLVTVAA